MGEKESVDVLLLRVAYRVSAGLPAAAVISYADNSGTRNLHYRCLQLWWTIESAFQAGSVIWSCAP
jgi:hypothetical protein